MRGRFQMIGVFIAALLTPSAALAGGMSSGGGEMVRDNHNPWFLENTPTVTYCIKVDAAGISLDKSQIAAWITRSIAQWKGIFANYQITHPKNVVRIATQNWIQTDCSADVNVRFQFGWGTLDPAQIESLSQGGDPHRYIALAMRETYDVRALRATGYVYIASDMGPNAFIKEPGQMDRPWRYPALLFAELTHELGHVFGLPHLNSELLPSSNRGMMSEYFPEVILQEWLWQGNRSELFNPTELSYFFSPTVYWDCHLQRSALDFFGVPEGTQCLRYEMSFQNGSLQSIRVSAIGSLGELLSELHPISPAGSGSWQFQSDITVYLSPSQTVFPIPLFHEAPYALGPGPESIQLSANTVRAGGASEPVFVIANEESIQLITNQPAGLLSMSTGHPDPDLGSSSRKNRSARR